MVNTPVICGGQDLYYPSGYHTSCYSLKESGAWKHESDLNTARRYAATGSVIMKDNLVLAGGFKHGSLDTIEVVAPNTKSETLPISLPVAMHAPCMLRYPLCFQVSKI